MATSASPYWVRIGDLANAMYTRRRQRLSDPMGARALIEAQEWTVLLIDMITSALEDHDVSTPELDEALDLAEHGHLLKSSDYLAQRLREYKRSMSAV